MSVAAEDPADFVEHLIIGHATSLKLPSQLLNTVQVIKIHGSPVAHRLHLRHLKITLGLQTCVSVVAQKVLAKLRRLARWK